MRFSPIWFKCYTISIIAKIDLARQNELDDSTSSFRQLMIEC